jgi:hypothetical protein
MRPTYVDGNGVDVNSSKEKCQRSPAMSAYWSKMDLTWKRGHF